MQASSARSEPMTTESNPPRQPTSADAPVIVLRTRPQPSTARVVAIASGKGGVGKTNIAANFALALGRRGLRVLAVDADLGLANLDIVLGLAPGATSADVVSGAVAIEDALVPGPHDVWLLPGASGDFDAANLADVQRHELFSAIDTLDERFDTVVLDTGSGLGPSTLGFCAAAAETLLVVTADPTGLSDALATLRVLSHRHGVRDVKVAASLVGDHTEGLALFEKLEREALRSLDVRLEYLGAVPFDPHVGRAIMRGLPVSEAYPNSDSSVAIADLAQRFLESTQRDTRSGATQIFWRRLLRQQGAGQ